MTAYSAPVGAPIWFDLSTTDPLTAASFYNELFGWDAEVASEEFGGYQNFTLNGKRVAGMMPYMPEGGGPENVWSVYLRTDDAAATSEAVKQAGGHVIVEPMKVGDEGTMAVFIDPAGAAIGAWQSDKHTGFAEWGVPGAPYWFENLSTDQPAAVPFYEKVFGARPQVVEGAPGNYTQYFWGDTSYGATMNAAGMLPEGTPSYWGIYITVDDVEATLQKAVDLGGGIVMGPDVTPWGTLAAITDPLGAIISLGKAPEGM
ncbi:VOC family protein [Gordonia sp. PP30]|uniref:VOC family protein n=1 Tax=unclassified Gordonia (in: high G+C Gram-positive bacteria) TaxID=2657482 RepID=UPI001FFEF470|nr:MULTISPECIES: VOC family protein [unclassified Gordonia (in: high G+C Gram-positive bacteria)]UQE75652.1 VOC family protein [Gordonia sp. PP30]